MYPVPSLSLHLPPSQTILHLSTVRYNMYDSAFSQKTRVLPFYQKGRTGKGNTQMTVTERSFALCILYQCLRMYQFSHSVVTLCDPMDLSTPGLPVHHQLLEFIQTHVH